MGLVLILISFFAFLFSFIGIVPIEKDIPIFQPDEMKKFILSRKKDKKILLYSSVFLLLFAFACSLVFLILKTLRRWQRHTVWTEGRNKMNETDFTVCFSCKEKIFLKDLIFENRMELYLSPNSKKRLFARCPKCNEQIIIEVWNGI